ncbi:hypothetical protein F2P81_018340 [Scophthalmus maximus]|uniref:Elongator complex protein 5 n=1 Tax=Scophthalmus maximus TaxID=52904 RepID=A0A6A4SA49_SCOMX|nr:hypothetical protein F2P81_018340 [Scophthalmus maximus]
MSACVVRFSRLFWSTPPEELHQRRIEQVLGQETGEPPLTVWFLNAQLHVSVPRLHFHNAFSDPLGWTDHPAFTVHQFNLEELTHLVKQTSHPKAATTLVIDSLSWILRHVSPSAVCKTLQQLKKGGAVRATIGLLHADMHQRGTVGSICHLATSVITVAPGAKGDEAVAKITKRSKSGKVIQEEEIFNIKEDLTVMVQSKASHTGPKQPGPEEQETDPTANLTFNLRLSDTEREAKEKLALPFVFSKAK